MIHFFRRIRQNILSKQKFGQYLLYAIGEIILVIIGILIALQINNWNQHQNNNAKLESFILQYREDLKLNVKLFESEILDAQYYRDRNIKLLRIKEFTHIPVDTLETWAETFYAEFETNNSVYESFKNSQIIEFGKYQSIISGMQRYYTRFYPFARMTIDNHNIEVDKADNFWRNEQDAYELDYRFGSDATIQTPEERKSLLIALLKQPKPRNILKTDSRKKEFIISRMNSWINFHEDRIEEIDKTLNMVIDD